MKKSDKGASVLDPEPASSSSLPNLAKPETSFRKGRPSPDLSRKRQEAVLLAAEEVFAACGYRVATMEMIARRAGVSKRSLYLWHADKAALFEACVAEGARAVHLPDLSSTLPPAAALAQYGEVLLEAVSTERAMRVSGLLYREAAGFAEVRHALNEGARVICRPVVEYLRRRSVDLERAEQLASMFLAALLAPNQNAILNNRPAPDPAANQQYLALTVDVFANGLG